MVGKRRITWKADDGMNSTPKTGRGKQVHSSDVLYCIPFQSREQISQWPVALPFGNGGDMISATIGFIPFNQVRTAR